MNSAFCTERQNGGSAHCRNGFSLVFYMLTAGRLSAPLL